ncbi:replication initiation protein [Emticicia oligotrophica]|uniref:replication initiation protein n=1 Tax=Emticicia oligotrophica TaxID=312279 RepID=UPI00273C3E26|nr:replication initiation protein [Emticicia oligotrophica]
MTNFAINQGYQQQLFVQPVVAVPSNEISADIIEQLNDLIMAQYDMSLFERRIFIAIIEQISDDLLEVGHMKVVPEILLDARQIIAASGLKGESAFQELQKATINLIKHVCKITEADGLLQVSLLSSAKYMKGKGQIKLQIDSNLHQYLLKLKRQFSIYSLEKLILFKSYYSQCLYELFRKMPKSNGTLTLSVEQLRKILRVGETEYERYYDFKRYIIQQAQKEFAIHDTSFDFKEKKQGKKVIALQFIFRK